MFVPSPQGIRFTTNHEGTVTRAYKDQGGIWTIGQGFTNLSPVCKAWFIEHFGHPLQAGDTITPDQCAELLKLVMEHETVPLANSLKPANQDAFDAENDVIYNCGPRAVGWQWALSAKAQDYAKAASTLLTTAITAQGKPSRGLVQRRRDEAALLTRASNPTAGIPVTTPDSGITRDAAGIKVIQQGLTKLKYYTGPIDGIYDSPAFIKASKNFQRAYGLRVDGRWGTASRSTLNRALASAQVPTITGGSGLGVGGTGFLADHFGWVHLDNPWVLVGLAVAALVIAYGAFLVWHNRGGVLRKRPPA
jgi:lysozyme